MSDGQTMEGASLGTTPKLTSSGNSDEQPFASEGMVTEYKPGGRLLNIPLLV